MSTNHNHEEKKREYVTILLVPIWLGTKSRNQMLSFKVPPTKEYALKTVKDNHDFLEGNPSYRNEWLFALETLKQVPEEKFAEMNQGRSFKFTYEVFLSNGDSQISKILTARSVPLN